MYLQQIDKLMFSQGLTQFLF